MMVVGILSFHTVGGPFRPCSVCWRLGRPCLPAPILRPGACDVYMLGDAVNQLGQVKYTLK